MQRCAAVVQAFFPGEEGAGAVAGVLSGRVNPSGRLPVSLPRSAGAQPYTYLHPALGEGSEVTNLPTTPAAPFGFGLSYTTFAYCDLAVPPQVPTDGTLPVSVRVTNTGAIAGDDVVQLYGRDVLGSVTRPVAQLLGYPAACTWSPASRRRFGSPCRQPGWRSPTARTPEWSRLARSSCGWGRASNGRSRPGPCWPDPPIRSPRIPRGGPGPTFDNAAHVHRPPPP